MTLPTRASKPEYNPAKFRELMLYIADKCRSDEYFGATKLNKILFFSDFLWFGMTGNAITGATYLRQKNGPAPLQLKPMEREIEADRDGIVVVKPFFNKKQRRLQPLRAPNRALFSSEELDLVEDVIKALEPFSATEASFLSHERSRAWQIAEPGAEIPYTAVFLSSRKATPGDVERGKELASKYGWLEQSTAS